ncbi:transposase [Streptomyces griseorubiginosus]|uniref:transposase n=1 Tax=Streptomyces griseorubiginosus TaxID=67304 RepID=UPI0036A2070E
MPTPRPTSRCGPAAAARDGVPRRGVRDQLLGVRGRLPGVHLVVTDQHARLAAAVRKVMLGAAWQRCRAH